MEQAASDADAVIGMSLGGVAAGRPALAIDLPGHGHSDHRMAYEVGAVVDVTPEVNDPGRVMTPEQRGSVALVSGPPTYESFAAVFDATMKASPNRTEAGV